MNILRIVEAFHTCAYLIQLGQLRGVKPGKDMDEFVSKYANKINKVVDKIPMSKEGVQ